jgi:hypothetical protein
MKLQIKHVVPLVVALFANAALAQWLPNPAPANGPIYYPNVVGIGIPTPNLGFQLHVKGLTGALIETSISSLGGGVGPLNVLDSSPLAADVGGSIALRGVFRSDGASGLLGGIKAGKRDAASGSLESYLAFYSRNHVTGITEQVRIDHAGNVGIGTVTPTQRLDVQGNARFSGDVDVVGTIHAKYQDLAEWVPAVGDLGPGTVVVLDTTSTNTVIASSSAYDSSVAGVISPQPGLALGESGPGKVLVATTGRVRVRATASNGPIRIGDLLVTSPSTGQAMKSAPVEIGGVSVHRPGTLLGKALEPLASGEGEILVLLSLQ